MATCMAVNDRISCVAVGLRNGTIVLYQGDFLTKRRKSPNVHVIAPQPSPYDDHTPLSVSFLGFKPFGNLDILFVVTSKNIFKFNVYAGLKNRTKPFFLEDERQFAEHFGRGATPCCCMSETSRDLIVGGKKGIWFYNETGRGQCVGFGGAKAHIHSFKDFLVVISLEKKFQDFIKVLTVYDVRHKLIVYKRDDKNTHYLHVTSQWNFIVGIVRVDLRKKKKPGEKSPEESDGQPIESYQMQLFKEIDIQNKVRVLLDKNRFQLAYQFVRPFDNVQGIRILKMYGDYEYNTKNNYSTAMEQYIKTIGHEVVEPSYVIRKYLDAQKIDQLTKYLEALHEKNVADAAHTTLLLNCYTKLKHKRTNEKLDSFIKKYATLKYDVSTAIKVCRSSNYIVHALELATRHEQHDWFIKIQIENLHNYSEALRHIESLGFTEAEENLKKYSQVLLSKIPKETTNVLIRLCVNYFPLPKNLKKRVVPKSLYIWKKSLLQDESYQYKLIPSESERSKPEYFIPSFSAAQFWLMIFLENVLYRTDIEKCSMSIMNTLIELYIKNLDADEKLQKLLLPKSQQQNEDEIEEEGEEEDHYDYCIEFCNEEQRQPIKGKVLKMIEKGSFNEEHVTFLVHSYNFSEGILKLYEKTNSYNQIIRHYMREKDYEKLLMACRQYGKTDQNVWVEVLSFFANKDFNVDDDTLKSLLNDENNQLPALQIIQILSKNENASLGTIKEYLIKKLHEERREIEEDAKKTREMQEETEAMKEQIEELRTKSKIFQASNCSECTNQLKLPTVHFMCGHSYHSHCLRNIDGMSHQSSIYECKICKERNQNVIETIKRFEESSENVEDFFNQLQRDPTKGFSTVSDYFGRAIFKNLEESNSLKHEMERKTVNFRKKDQELHENKKDLFSTI